MAATRATLDDLLPGVSTAVDAYDAGLIDVELVRAIAATESVDYWGSELLEQAQALRCLHQLAQLGHLAFAGVEDPGERGTITNRSTSSYSYATEADVELGTTRWGRTLIGLRKRIDARSWPLVTGTGY